MKNSIILFFLMAIAIQVNGQTVTFRDGQFQNGMTYPLVVFPSNRASELAINRNLDSHLITFKERDFCIGQYGYVQKASFLQIHIYVNCIDMDDSENHYYFYDLQTGEIATIHDMLNPRTEDEFNIFFKNELTRFLAANSIELNEEESLDNFEINDLNAILHKDGVYFTSTMIKNWGENRFFVKWTDLQTYLKVSYL